MHVFITWKQDTHMIHFMVTRLVLTLAYIKFTVVSVNLYRLQKSITWKLVFYFLGNNMETGTKENALSLAVYGDYATSNVCCYCVVK